MTSQLRGVHITAIIATLVLLALPASAAGPSAIQELRSPAGISFDTTVQWDHAELSVSGPAGVKEWTVPSGKALRIDVADLVAWARQAGVDADGDYTYEITLAPVLDDATRAALATARATGDDSIVEELRAKGALPAEPAVASGHLSLEGGAIVLDSGTPEPMPAVTAEAQPVTAERGSVATEPATPDATAQGIQDPGNRDQVIADDLIVQGSGCIGFDCVNNENFGFDTVRLKENNLRIKFEDTSTSSGFPTEDWQLTANDSASGGVSRFSIDDITAGTTPFTVRAGAKSNSIYVDSSGRLGLKTSTPVVDIHTKSGNTPTLRLEQDSSSGFSAQTWDVAGNETNFFVRDVTNGSKLPFKIIPGAPTNSLYVNSAGNIGLATSSPDAVLDVESKKTDDRGYLNVRNTSTSDVSRIMLYLENYGNVVYRLKNTQSGAEWANVMGTSGYVFNNVNNPGNEFRIANNGDIYVNNVMVHSSRTLKTDFRKLDPQSVLDRVLKLPITEWRYKIDDTGQHHIGPVAEDFQAAFGLSANTKTIGVSDLSGVALASIQALDARVEQRDAQIAKLEKENAELQQRLTDIEEAISQLRQQDK